MKEMMLQSKVRSVVSQIQIVENTVYKESMFRLVSSL